MRKNVCHGRFCKRPAPLPATRTRVPTRLAYSIELEADGIEQPRTEFTIDTATRSCKTNRSFREIYRPNTVFLVHAR